MTVIPDVNGYAKNLNHQQMLRKTRKNYWKPKKY